MNSTAFTLKAQGGLLRVLITDCNINQAAPPVAPGSPVSSQGFHSFKAIWDTGATGTVITQAVVDACKIQATGMTQVHGVSGIVDAETYLIDVALPNGVLFPALRVTKGQLPGGDGGDVLIGMDIISQGDFAITGKGGVTWFSFRMPSSARLDFVDQINVMNEKVMLDAAKGKKPKKAKPPKAGKGFGRRK